MNIHIAKLSSRLLASGLLVAAAALAHAQPYPAKPVRMIAPYPPGGTSDAMARIVAQKLGDAFGRQVVVENRPGAASNIGHEIAAKAAPDGYTLVLTSGAAMVTNQFLYKKLNWDPHGDFAPVSLVSGAGMVLVVHPSVPAQDVKQLIALAKARPDRMTFGSGGVGTTSHVTGEMFKSVTGVKMVHVPYKGGVLATTDLVGGQIDLSFSDMVPAVPQVQSGRLRALAVTSEQRAAALPKVPTMPEAGLNHAFPAQWWGVMVPRGTPPAIISRINADIAQFMKAPDLQERFTAMGVFARYSTPEQMTETIRQGTALMREIVKAAGIQPE
jgi:tripartite-type tricarboxylate transporter receptor subunit TctC